jgi:hypothetical protein
MSELTYTIAPDKVAEYVEAYCYIHKNGEMTDDEVPVAKYTDVQWVREHIMRSIKGQIVRGKNAMAKDALTSNEAESVT